MAEDPVRGANLDEASGAGAGKASERLEIPVTGMSCASCSAKIEDVLGGVEGVESAGVNFADSRATVVYEPGRVKPGDLVSKIEALGYGVATSTVELAVEGISCASCAARIEKKLNRIDGVTATVNYATERAHVTAVADVADEALVEAVEAIGYAARLPAPASAARPRARCR